MSVYKFDFEVHGYMQGAGKLVSVNDVDAVMKAVVDDMQLDVDKLKQRIAELEKQAHKNEVELLKALMYAPSSPVSPNKALEIEVWYGKFKQLRKQAKQLEEQE